MQQIVLKNITSEPFFDFAPNNYRQNVKTSSYEPQYQPQKPQIMDLSILKSIVDSQSSTMASLAQVTGMSKSTLYRCIRLGTIKAQHLELIANTLGIGISTFFPPEFSPLVIDPNVAIGNKSNHSFNGASVNVNNKKEIRNNYAARISFLERELATSREKIRLLEHSLRDKERLIKMFSKSQSVQE